MELLSLPNITSIGLLVAPGYLAIWTYASIFAKRPKSFSHSLVESVAISLPLIAVVSWLWQLFLHTTPALNDVIYLIALFVFSFAVSIVCAKLRVMRPIRNVMSWFGFGMPDEDFVRSRFNELKKADSSVTVTLKSGDVFNGTPKEGKVFSVGAPREYYFDHIAWYNNDTQTWDERQGGLIINMNEVNYMELTK